MSKDTHYRYHRIGARKDRLDMDELPGHRFCVIVRTDILVPNDPGHAYKAACSCRKWEGEEWRMTRALARKLDFPGHIEAAAKQGVLF